MFGVFTGGKLTSQILRDVPYAIATLVAYEILQSASTRIVNEGGSNVTRSSKVSDAFCGALAGGFGTFVTTPMVCIFIYDPDVSGRNKNSDDDQLRAFLRDSLCFRNAS